MRVAPAISLTEQQRQQLEGYARGRSVAVRLALRANMILLAAGGLENRDIAEQVGVGRDTVALWRNRFVAGGIAGIVKDASRRGRKPKLSERKIQEIVRKTTQEKPTQATHWSTRSMARATGLSAAMIGRIWRRHGVKPHRVKRFKLSNDPQFAEKVEDIVGLYLRPPEHALVLSVDEKSQIQALDRTQPGLPLKKGRCGTMTHDYKRHGTTTLFAALSVLDGTVISECMDRHRHQEWLRFLNRIDRETPADKQIHLVVDNYATHKHPKVQRWFQRHPRFHAHFTPTSASWLNMIERFFRDLTVNRVRRGVFRSVPDLITAIQDYIAHHNQRPKPFIWTAKASDILEKVKRGRAALNKMASA
jgi:transposase